MKQKLNICLCIHAILVFGLLGCGKIGLEHKISVKQKSLDSAVDKVGETVQKLGVGKDFTETGDPIEQWYIPISFSTESFGFYDPRGNPKQEDITKVQRSLMGIKNSTQSGAYLIAYYFSEKAFKIRMYHDKIVDNERSFITCDFRQFLSKGEQAFFMRTLKESALNKKKRESPLIRLALGKPDKLNTFVYQNSKFETNPYLEYFQQHFVGSKSNDLPPCFRNYNLAVGPDLVAEIDSKTKELSFSGTFTYKATSLVSKPRRVGGTSTWAIARETGWTALYNVGNFLGISDKREPQISSDEVRDIYETLGWKMKLRPVKGPIKDIVLSLSDGKRVVLVEEPGFYKRQKEAEKQEDLNRDILSVPKK